MEKKKLANNKSARADYFIEEVYEAGIELFGTEVKSIRYGGANLKQSYAEIKKNEVFLVGMHINPYEKGNIFNTDPLRDKKLLLHKSEIRKIEKAINLKGYTLIPLSLYLSNGLVKVELAVARGKKLYDKREGMAKKETEKKMRRALRQW